MRTTADSAFLRGIRTASNVALTIVSADSKAARPGWCMFLCGSRFCHPFRNRVLQTACLAALIGRPTLRWIDVTKLVYAKHAVSARYSKDPADKFAHDSMRAGRFESGASMTRRDRGEPAPNGADLRARRDESRPPRSSAMSPAALPSHAKRRSSGHSSSHVECMLVLLTIVRRVMTSCGPLYYLER